MHYVTRMYLGQSIPEGASPAYPLKAGRPIPADAFDRFVIDTVAAAFPDGYTILKGVGGWRDTTNGVTIHEDAYVLEVYHDGGIHKRDAVRNVAVTYRQRFGQDAVMVSTLNLSEGVQFL